MTADRRRAGRALLVMLLAVSGVSPAAADDRAPERLPKGYVCYKARSPVVVDGRLDDAAWKDAPWTDDFVDIEGEIRPRPRFRTRAKMLWDDRFFYVAAELREPHVWGTLKNHDSVIFQDNDFEVFIDPDGDHHEYYEFEINALNTGWDLFLKKPYRDGGPALNSWEIPGLKTATHVEGTLNDSRDSDRSWSVELAFPWKVLAEYAHRPAPPREGDQWRVNFSRVEWLHNVEDGRYVKVPGRKEDNWVWSPQGVVDMHRPERWGYVQFSAEAPGTVDFRVDPAGPVRDHLVEIYQAQKRYHGEKRVWASSLDSLGLPAFARVAGEGNPVLRVAGTDGFEASITLEGREGRPRQTWTIRQDSRLSHSD